MRHGAAPGAVGSQSWYTFCKNMADAAHAQSVILETGDCGVLSHYCVLCYYTCIHTFWSAALAHVQGSTVECRARKAITSSRIHTSEHNPMKPFLSSHLRRQTRVDPMARRHTNWSRGHITVESRALHRLCRSVYITGAGGQSRILFQRQLDKKGRMTHDRSQHGKNNNTLGVSPAL